MVDFTGNPCTFDPRYALTPAWYARIAPGAVYGNAPPRAKVRPGIACMERL